jgi:hypothetical protein
MAFDPTQGADPNGINPQTQGGDDISAPQSAPQATPVAPQAPPQNGQPSQPQAKPATPPGSPQTTKDFFHNLSHSFVGSVLGALAGKEPTRYVVDSTGKTIPDPTQAKPTAGDNLRSIASNALQGLAAGAQVPQQKSKAASLAAGLGAGAQAQSQNAERKDDKAKKAAGDDYEREQQQILRRHDIARGNALQMSTMQHINQEELDHDPERQKNRSLATSAEAEGLDVKYLSESEAQKMFQTDPKTLIAEHHLLPVGFKAVRDADGNPVFDQDGNPKMEGQLALINGMQDGEFTPPESFYADAKKYGKLGGASDTDGLQSGQPISVENFGRLHGAILEGKKAEHQGWVKPEDVFGGADGKIPMQRNTSTGELRAYPAGVVPNIENKPAESAAKAAKDTADANKKDNTGEVTPALRYVQEMENHRAEIKQKLDAKDQTLGKSYETQNKEFDTIRKPIATQLDSFSTLRSSLDQGTATGDSVVAPALLKALVAGGGVRITQAEISNFTHGRSTVEDFKGILQKMSDGESITPEQRKQVYSLLGAVESKARQKSDILASGQEAIDNAASVAEQRQAVRDTRTKLDAIDRDTPKPQLPKEAIATLKEGVHTTFKNGQTWTLTNGQPVQIGSN